MTTAAPCRRGRGVLCRLTVFHGMRLRKCYGGPLGVSECLGIPLFVWGWLLARRRLRTAFAIWRKVGEGLLCWFACFSLMMFMRPACVWNGCVALIVLLGYACLLHVTNPKSGDCKSTEVAVFRHLKTCFLLVIQRLSGFVLIGASCTVHLTTYSCTCICMFSA